MSKYQKLLVEARDKMVAMRPEDESQDWASDCSLRLADDLIPDDMSSKEMAGLIAGNRDFVTSPELQRLLVKALRMHVSDRLYREFEDPRYVGTHLTPKA